MPTSVTSRDCEVMLCFCVGMKIPVRYAYLTMRVQVGKIIDDVIYVNLMVYIYVVVMNILSLNP